MRTLTTEPAPTQEPSLPRAELPEPERYQPLARLGAGGMGVVWRVHDRRLERTLAMKLILPELSADPSVRARFRNEVRLTAGLAHPSIVVVFDAGEDAGGRLWYTLQEVEQGRTLRWLLSTNGPNRLTEGVPILRAVAEAIAYAHERGVLHRDLKPGNVLTGRFSEVLVLDWGIARRIDAREVVATAGTFPGTAAGRTLGTPPYAPPEQVTGRPEDHGPHSDVYALGAMLHELLVGEPPFGGDPNRMGRAFARGEAAPRVSADAAPPELAALVDEALRFRPGERLADARALADRLRGWEDRMRARALGLAAVERARQLRPRILELEEEAGRLRQRASASAPAPFAPEAEKWPVWELEDAAAAAERTATDLEIQEEQALRAALDHLPDLAEAHRGLADHYGARLRRDEERGDATAATRWEALVRAHDRGFHARWLAGDGALTLHTEPAGADVTLFRVVERRRRRVLERVGELGRTPLIARELPRGSWVARLSAPGCTAVDCPVFIGRGEHWDGVPPGERESLPVLLPAEGTLGPDDRYVPPGWCWVGGDPEATDALPRLRRWVDGFVVRRHPVTVAEYLQFLQDVVHGSGERLLSLAPRQTAGAAANHPILAPDRDGSFVPVPDPDGVSWGLRWPVTLVDWDACMAFAAWEAHRSGFAWRLPHSIEWEKAARGVDARKLPWGDHFEPTWACTAVARPGAPTRADVDAFPTDESIYGVRGLVGNVRDRCLDVYTRLPDPAERLRPEPPAPGDRRLRIARGGAWLASLPLCRPAGRFADPPDRRMSAAGFRLVRSL